jgi:acetylornithine deacetylase/succinyl-diaminopimelate desuccinylase-like protein
MKIILRDALSELERRQDTAVAQLCDLLRIASVSTDPDRAGECQRAADWVAGQLAECGLAVRVHPTGGHPVVLGRYEASAAAPRLLFYGHYDVQPPDPLDKWTTPPFEPSIREGRIYARGACDDKGQFMCFVEALRAWKTAAGGPPINLTVLIEGEEEIGSTHLDAFIEQHKAELSADIAAISDTAMWDRDTPAITYALRGLLYFDVQLHGPGRDLHSGVYGGSVANPATELALVLGQLLDDRHRVTIPGFYDDVRPVSEAERAVWASLRFDEKQYAASIGLTALHGERDFSTLERRWARPSCDVNGLYGGYMGEGAKTVIPSYAGAKVSFRLAADQNPRKIEEAFRRWFEQRTPPGCAWKITQHGAALPVAVGTDTPHMQAAKRAMETAFGRPPVLIREGATIPVVATFKQHLGLDTLLLGFGLNDDNLHSPNEKFDLANFHRGCRTYAALLAELAGSTPPVA